MSDETVVTEVTAPTEAATTTNTATDAGKTPEVVFTQAQVDALIKERLERANRKADETAKKAASDAEAKALADQGKFKELYEKAIADAQAAEQRAKTLELSNLKRDVATRVGLPAGLAARLQGDDEQAIEADARSLLESLPKPTAPNINSAAGSGHSGAPLPAGLTEESIAAQAIRLGVDPVQYRKQLLRS